MYLARPLLVALQIACLLSRVFAAPDLPKVGLVDLTVDEGVDPNSLAWAGNVTAALQAELAGETDVIWIERTALDRVWSEFSLGLRGRTDAASTLRIGHWIGADWLLLADLQRDGAKLRAKLRIIEVQRAATLAEVATELPAPPERSQSVQPTELAPLAEATRSLLRAAVNSAHAEKGAVVIAPLFFRNTGPTERLDFLEKHLREEFLQRCTQPGAIRVLNFSGTTEATQENEMALLGLTTRDSAAWRQVADYYVWGRFEENPVPGERFEDQPVIIAMTVWNGVDAPQPLEWKGKVSGLPAGISQLADQMRAITRQRPARVAAAQSARLDVAQSLDKRAAEIENRIQAEVAAQPLGKDQPFLHSTTGKRLLAYRLNLLQLACFFDGANRSRQLARLEAAWGRRWPLHQTLSVAQFWERFQDYRNVSEAFPVDAHGNPDSALRQQRLDSLQEAAQVWGATLFAGSLAERRLVSACLVRSTEVWGDEVVAFDQWARTFGAPESEWLKSHRDRWFRFLLFDKGFGDQLGAAAIRKCVAKVWPVLKPAYGSWRDSITTGAKSERELLKITEYVIDQYEVLGAIDEAVAMLTTPTASPPAQDRLAGPGTLRPEPPGLPAEWSPPALAVAPTTPRLPDAQPFPNCPPLPVRVREIEWWSTMTYAFPPSSFPGASAAAHFLRKDPHRTIDALASDGPRLWIASTNQDKIRANPADSSATELHVVDPVTDRVWPISAQLGPHSAISQIAFSGGSAWVAFAQSGLCEIGTAENAVNRFENKDGLAVTQAQAVAADDSTVVIAGQRLDGSTLWQYFDRRNRTWYDLPPALQGTTPGPANAPQAGQDSFARSVQQQVWRAEDRIESQRAPANLALFQDWIVVARGDFHLYHRPSKGWQPWRELVRTEQFQHYDRWMRDWGLRRPDGSKPPASHPPAPEFWSSYSYSQVSSDERGFWLGGPRGLLFFDPRQPVIATRQISAPPVTAMAHDGDFLWVALDPPLALAQAFGLGVERKIALLDKRTMTWVGAIPLVGDDPVSLLTGSNGWIYYAAGSSVRGIDARAVLPPQKHSDLETAGRVAPRWLAPNAPYETFLHAAAFDDVETLAATPRPPPEIRDRALRLAARAGAHRSIDWLLEHGADPNTSEPDGEFALRNAAAVGDLAALERLKKGGARLDYHGARAPCLMENPQNQGRVFRSLDDGVASHDVQLKPTAKLAPDNCIVVEWPPVAGALGYSIGGKIKGTGKLRGWNLTPPGGNFGPEVTRYVIDHVGFSSEATYTFFGHAVLPGGTAPGLNPASTPQPAAAVVVPGDPNLIDSAYGPLANSGLFSEELPAFAVEETALLAAVRTGNTDGISWLLAHGAPPDQPNALWERPVLVAARRGDGDNVWRLTEAGADLNQVGPSYQTPLREVYRQHSDRALLIYLLEHGAKPEQILYQVVNDGRRQDFEFLLSHGLHLDPRAYEDLAASALSNHRIEWAKELFARRGPGPVRNARLIQTAVEDGDPELVETIIGSGADINLTVENKTLLGVAVAADRYAIAARLLALGARDRPPDVILDGIPASQLAKTPEMKALFAAKPQTVVLSKGVRGTAIVPTPYSSDFTAPASSRPELEAALADAAGRGDIAGVATALHAGAWINAQLADGKTPLIRAIAARHLDAVRYLLEQGADPNGTTEAGWSALTFAVGTNDEALVRLLLERGSVPDHYGRTLEAGPSLLLATQKRDSSLAKLLLDHGANASGCTMELSPLIVASRNGDLALLELLLDRGANPNGRTWTMNSEPNFTALMAAARVNQVAILQRLLRAGARLDACDASGQNALDHAVTGNATEAAAFLRSKGLRPPPSPQVPGKDA